MKKALQNHQNNKTIQYSQTLNPVLTVYLPTTYRVFTLIVKTTNHEEIHWILSYFYALFPVLNPLIIICCVQD